MNQLLAFLFSLALAQSNPSAAPSAATQPATAPAVSRPAAEQQAEVAFTGTVASITALGPQSPPCAVPVDFDPKFILVVRVASAEPAKGPVQPGQDATFAIHSPVRLFSEPAESVVGQTCEFTITWRSGPPEKLTGLLVKSIAPPRTLRWLCKRTLAAIDTLTNDAASMDQMELARASLVDIRQTLAAYRPPEPAEPARGPEAVQALQRRQAAREVLAAALDAAIADEKAAANPDISLAARRRALAEARQPLAKLLQTADEDKPLWDAPLVPVPTATRPG